MGQKTLDLTEFVQQGYLQEVNRQFFHPFGLALYVTVKRGTQMVCDERRRTYQRLLYAADNLKHLTVTDRIVDRQLKELRAAVADAQECGPVPYEMGVIDCRENPDGFAMDLTDLESRRKHQHIEATLERRSPRRRQTLGWIVQPIGTTIPPSPEEEEEESA